MGRWRYELVYSEYQGNADPVGLVAGGTGTGSRCQPVHCPAMGTIGDDAEQTGADTTGEGDETGRRVERKEGGQKLKIPWKRSPENAPAGDRSSCRGWSVTIPPPVLWSWDTSYSRIRAGGSETHPYAKTRNGGLGG